MPIMRSWNSTVKQNKAALKGPKWLHSDSRILWVIFATDLNKVRLLFPVCCKKWLEEWLVPYHWCLLHTALPGGRHRLIARKLLYIIRTSPVTGKIACMLELLRTSSLQKSACYFFSIFFLLFSLSCKFGFMGVIREMNYHSPF